jgi:hypothetical protein
MYGGMSKTAQVPKTSEAIPNWQISVNYVETCNCDYGCPCNFSGFPTYGFCRAIVFMRINKGNFGDTRLDGLSVVLAESWPKAIHEGDGTQQIYVSKEANKAQREAIEKIWYGRAKGNGHFAVFAGATKYFLEPHQVQDRRQEQLVLRPWDNRRPDGAVQEPGHRRGIRDRGSPAKGVHLAICKGLQNEKDAHSQPQPVFRRVGQERVLLRDPDVQGTLSRLLISVCE